MRALQRIVLIALLAAGDAGATAVLGDGQQLWSPQRMTAAVQSAIATLRSKVDAALADADGSRAVSLLDEEPDPLVRHWVAHELLLAQAAGPRSVAAERLRDWALQQPLVFLRRHEETAADWFLPLIDLAADARDLDRGWSEQEQRERWRRRWQQEPRAAIESLRAASADEQGRAAEAVAELDAAAFARWRAELDALPPEGVPVALWLALAARAVEPRAIVAVLARGDGEAKLSALELLRSWPDAAALPLLEQVELDPELASAATLALVPRLLAVDSASPAVLARLSAPKSRDSAAAALARLPEAQAAAHLRKLWSASTTESERAGLRHAVLLDARPAVQKAAGDWTVAGEQP